MTSLTKDLSITTNIQEKYLEKFMDTVEFIIADAVDDAKKSSEDITEVDLGIGVLLIGVEGNEVKYKFIPSKSLEERVKLSLKGKKSSLQVKLEHSLVEKVRSLYKELV